VRTGSLYPVMNDNADLLAQAFGALAEQPGRSTSVRYPNNRVTDPGECSECDGPLAIPRRADARVCSRRCRVDRGSRLVRERKLGARTSLDG
jgi:hypothetical protein